MSGTSDATRDTYVTGLRNQHAVENQAVELLQRQVDRLENYPAMADMLRRHISESQEQARRIEDLLGGLGESHSSIKDMVMSLAGNMAAIMHTAAQDEVLKNTFANLAFENFEIAAYTSLITLAEHLGHGQANTALNQSLREEQAMAEFVRGAIPQTTLTYVSLLGAGHKAGV